MCLRISSVALAALAAAACAPDTAALPGEMMECALGQGAALAPVCSLERSLDASDFVVHHPGGGFRRFRLDAASLAITPADGAEPATTARSDAGDFVVAIGADRYRIPAALLTDQP